MGKWLLQQINDTQNTLYHLQFDKNYMINEHRPAIKILINLVNVFIRRESKGCFFGIGTYVDIGHNTLEVEITPINQICLDELFFKYYKIQELQNEVLSMLNDEYKRGNNFLEVIYDPKIIEPQKIKDFNSIIDMIVNDIDSNCSCLRQINKHSSFTFTLLIFQKNKDFNSLQELMFGKRYQHLIIVILHFLQGKDNILDISHLTEQTTFYESFLPFINFILFLQYNYDVMLVAHTVVRQNVISVAYKKISSEDKRHYHYFYYDLKHALTQDQIKQMDKLYGTELEIFKKEMNIELRMSGISTDYSIQSVIKAISMMSPNDDAEMEDCDIDKVVQYITQCYQQINKKNPPGLPFKTKINLGHIGNDYVQENFELIQEKVNYNISKLQDDNSSPMYEDNFIQQNSNDSVQFYIQRILLNKRALRNTPFSNFTSETPRMLNEKLDLPLQRQSEETNNDFMLPPAYQDPYVNNNASIELLHENKSAKSQQNSFIETESREKRIARRKKKIASRKIAQEAPET